MPPNTEMDCQGRRKNDRESIERDLEKQKQQKKNILL